MELEITFFRDDEGRYVDASVKCDDSQSHVYDLQRYVQIELASKPHNSEESASRTFYEVLRRHDELGIVNPDTKFYYCGLPPSLF